MEIRNRFIAPQRMGAWLVVALGTALAAFVIAVFGVMESRTSYAVLQVQLLKFDTRIKSLGKSPIAATPSQAPSMPAGSK